MDGQRGKGHHLLPKDHPCKGHGVSHGVSYLHKSAETKPPPHQNNKINSATCHYKRYTDFRETLPWISLIDDWGEETLQKPSLFNMKNYFLLVSNHLWQKDKLSLVTEIFSSFVLVRDSWPEGTRHNTKTLVNNNYNLLLLQKNISKYYKCENNIWLHWKSRFEM